MTSIGSRVSGPLGFQTGNKDVQVYNRTAGAVTVGQLVQFDLQQTQAETTNSIFGDVGSSTSNVMVVQAGLQGYGIYGIVMKGAGDNELCTVRMQGVIDNAQVAGTVDPSAGAPLGPLAGTSTTQLATPAAGDKALAIALDDFVAGTPDTARVLFDGIYGFGNA